MKTITRILVILLVGLIVSGLLYLAVENTTLFSASEGASGGTNEFGQRPAMPEGNHQHHESAALGAGLTGVLSSLVKLGVITTIVLLIQGLVNLLHRRRVRQAATS